MEHYLRRFSSQKKAIERPANNFFDVRASRLDDMQAIQKYYSGYLLITHLIPGIHIYCP